MKKQKGKSQKAPGGKKKEEANDPSSEPTSAAPGTAGQEHTSEEKPKSGTDGAEDERVSIQSGEGGIAGEERPPEDEPGNSTKPPHNRQPSLSLQSKLRSSSFRRTSISQGPLSPNGTKSPELPVLSPDGDSVNSIYRKQAARLDELEKENRRLAKDLQDAEKRWRHAEEELEDLREGSGEVAELKSRAQKADSQMEEYQKLVRAFFTSLVGPQ